MASMMLYNNTRSICSAVRRGVVSYSTTAAAASRSERSLPPALITTIGDFKSKYDFNNKTVRILSGMQPTNGGLHIGNYIGAMINWVDLQDTIIASSSNNNKTAPPQHELLFSIVDLHSLTNKTVTAAQLRKNTLDVAIEYIACGIDPTKVTLFCQSAVPAHSELAWILSCHTASGRLENMVQFKEKSKKNTSSTNNSTYGLLAYPILMAADILLYKSTHVPVGEDQTQHVELTRKIAQAFNSHYKTDYFPLPQIVNCTESNRIMSLVNSATKMSKSDPSEHSRINLTDSDKIITSKIMKAATDATIGITYDIENRPNIANLLSIASAMSGQPIPDIAHEFKDQYHSKFKEYLAQTVINRIAPIRNKIEHYQANPKQVKDYLAEGAEKASKLAGHNLNEIKELIGIFNDYN
ncbi:hypothetical protein SAMD00019534_034530 [Acytostelium subglobosum LB1]|uniref:hypothetical protein n=1 Tax=Acytostelium subglobosum LB1 TaxID=1410327 RepID=UPI000644917F|nr:hypothetical protein SAMD00019534_034530 [Acytostelium subglobosum LB1]GAM20278.1 hypothetical protein SAMD00019534_034530 [Acytostelium subglobosum LB1]|eukprot:XP_012759799.1 hypothetical protein SAMD00019534_034530 [Acytostelium subglobosum LB1]